MLGCYDERVFAGFLSLKRHTPFAAEIYVMGVKRRFHRQGIGRALIDEALQFCGRQGVQFLTVKTLAPSHPDPHYEATRKFYEAAGFRPVEIFPTLLGLIQSVPADGQVTVGRPSDAHVHPIAAQPWRGPTMLTGAWLGFLDSGSNETDNWRRRRRAMTKAVWSTPMAKLSSVARIAHRPLAALMSVDAKTYVTRPAQARLTKTGRLARTASAQRTSRSLRRARHHERAQDCDREPTGSTVDF